MHSLTCLGKVCSDDASKNKCLDILCRVMYSVVQAPISTPFFFGFAFDRCWRIRSQLSTA